MPQEAPVGIEARLYLRAQTGEGPLTPYPKEGTGELAVTWAEGTAFERGVDYDTLLAFLTTEDKEALNGVLNGIMDRLVTKWMVVF
mgnify:CR=1 FL=1